MSKYEYVYPLLGKVVLLKDVTNPTRVPVGGLPDQCFNVSMRQSEWGGAPLNLAKKNREALEIVITNLRSCPQYSLIDVSISRRYAAAEKAAVPAAACRATIFDFDRHQVQCLLLYDTQMLAGRCIQSASQQFS